MYSGDSARPTIRSSRRRPLMIAPIESPGCEAVRGGEGLAGQHLVGVARLDVASLPEHDVAEDRAPDSRHGDQAADGGLGQPWNIERHIDDDARLDLGHAWNRRNLRGEREGRALERGEHVAEARALVVGAAA